MKRPVPFFSKNPLDRLDSTRRDACELQKLQHLPTSLFVLFHEEHVLVCGGECFFDEKILHSCEYVKDEVILLGVEKETHYFCVAVQKYPAALTAVNLREFALQVKEEKLGILAQSASVLRWHRTHPHCAACGAPTRLAHAGWRRDCTVCEKEHFPRTDPVVIMLVTHGEFCLLGRGVAFPEGRYSCLAGYVESGESIEAAARRELYEEAGILGGAVHYVSSQPWPFSSALMIGVHVEALTKEITIDPHELSDARWVGKEEVRALLKGDTSLGITTPSAIAIARNLLEYWAG